MVLPASGPISTAQIRTEIGGSGPIVIPSAEVRTLTGVASGPIILPNDFWGKSSESLLVMTNSGFFSDTATYNPPFVTSSTISLFINSNGTWNIQGSTSGIVASGNWISPTSAASTYEVTMAFSNLNGSTPSGTFGSYIALSSNRSWSLTNTIPSESASVDLLWTIRKVGSGTPSRSDAVTLGANLF